MKAAILKSYNKNGCDLEIRDIPVPEISKKEVLVKILHKDECVLQKKISYQPSFGWVAEGQEVLYNSSDGVLGIGINLGNFSEKYGISPSKNWTVTVSPN